MLRLNYLSILIQCIPGSSISKVSPSQLRSIAWGRRAGQRSLELGWRGQEPARAQALKDFCFVVMVIIWRLCDFWLWGLFLPFFLLLLAQGPTLGRRDWEWRTYMLSASYPDAQTWIMDSGVSPRKLGFPQTWVQNLWAPARAMGAGWVLGGDTARSQLW